MLIFRMDLTSNPYLWASVIFSVCITNFSGNNISVGFHIPKRSYADILWLKHINLIRFARPPTKIDYTRCQPSGVPNFVEQGLLINALKYHKCGKLIWYLIAFIRGPACNSISLKPGIPGTMEQSMHKQPAHVADKTKLDTIKLQPSNVWLSPVPEGTLTEKLLKIAIK